MIYYNLSAQFTGFLHQFELFVQKQIFFLPSAYLKQSTGLTTCSLFSLLQMSQHVLDFQFG